MALISFSDPFSSSSQPSLTKAQSSGILLVFWCKDPYIKALINQRDSPYSRDTCHEIKTRLNSRSISRFHRVLTTMRTCFSLSSFPIVKTGRRETLPSTFLLSPLINSQFFRMTFHSLVHANLSATKLENGISQLCVNAQNGAYLHIIAPRIINCRDNRAASHDIP